VLITSALDNKPKINKGLMGAPTNPLEHIPLSGKIEEDGDFLFIKPVPTGDENVLLKCLLKYVEGPINFFY
jgi:hypothetical protein